MKITFIFILILFIDSVNRVYRVQLELAAATEQAKKGGYVISPKPTPVPRQSHKTTNVASANICLLL